MKRFIVVCAKIAAEGKPSPFPYPVWMEFSEEGLKRHYKNHPSAVSLVAEAAVGEFVCVENDIVFRHADGEAEIEYFHDS